VTVRHCARRSPSVFCSEVSPQSREAAGRPYGRHPTLVLFCAICFLVAGCEDDKPTTPTDTADATVDVAVDVDSDANTSSDSDSDADVAPTLTAHVRFEFPATGLPAPLAIPFPSDLYRDGPNFNGVVTDALADWKLAGITQQSAVLQQAYTGLDGFGHTSGALFRLDLVSSDPSLPRKVLDLDVASLPKTGTACLAATSPVAIVDVTDPSQPTRLPCFAGYFERLGVLVVAPEGQPLQGGRRYAVVVSDQLISTDGLPVTASPAFAELLAGTRSTPEATLFGEALDGVSAAIPAWSAEHIAGMAVYSAHTEHRKLRTVRDALANGDYGPAPQLLTEASATLPYPTLRFCAQAQVGCTATLDEWLGIPLRDASGSDVPGAPGESGHPEPADTGWPHDAIGVVVQGAFTAPEFRRDWNGTPDPTDGNFSFVNGQAETMPSPVVVPLTLILPATAPPASGYPVVIYSHGTPSNRQGVMSIANELARAGIATVAMDGLYHGVRTADGTDDANNFPGTYVGPDGFSDASDTPASTIELSATLKSAARYRSNLWQYALEWCQLRRLVANPALDLSSAADQYAAGTALGFDGTRVGWVGTSFGAFTGATLLAVEPDIRAFFLNVGNGDALQWQGQSPSNRAQIEVVLFLFGMGSDVELTRFTPFVNIAFGAIEPGFAGSSAEDVDPAGPAILMTEVEYDEYVPNRSTELLAAALNIPLVVPAARPIPLLETSPSPVTGTAGKPARGLVYMGSASHSANLARRWNPRNYSFPVQLEDGVRPAFPELDPPIWVKQPVLATQAMMVQFLTTSFEGAGVIDAGAIPRVIDFDDDGWCDLTEQAAGSAWDDPSVHPTSAADCVWDAGF